MAERGSHKTAAQAKPSNWAGLVLGLAMLGLMLGLAYQHLSQPGQLPLQVVEVNGEFTYLDRAEIGRRVMEHIDGGFFTVDMPKIREAVLAMPWVEEVSVRRIWPDTLHMEVTEQQPLAYWGKDALVNLHGKIFRPQALPNFVQVAQLNADEKHASRVVNFYLKLYSALVDSDLRVSQLTLDQRQEWSVDFTGDLHLALGRRGVQQRLDDFLRLYPELGRASQRRPQRVDMRYEHGFAVRWHAQEEVTVGAVSPLARGDS